VISARDKSERAPQSEQFAAGGAGDVGRSDSLSWRAWRVVLVVTGRMGEDSSRIRQPLGPEVMAALRNAAIGLLRTMGVTNIAESLRRIASRVDELFARLGILKK
jgi:hypothetical protein